MDRLTKHARFIPVKSSYSEEDYAKIFLDESLFRHDILLSIISDQGTQFTSRFLRSFQKGLGIMVKLSTAFHPQTDGQAERTIQILQDMLRGCIMDLPLVEFAFSGVCLQQQFSFIHFHGSL